MAAAPQKQALEVIKKRVMQLDDRYDGYQVELIAALNDILTLESDRPHNIKQQVSRRIAQLGELLVQNKGAIE